MSRQMDRVLEEVGWIAARREMAERLPELAGDWLDFLTDQAIAVADRGNLPFDLVAEGFRVAARRWWPEAIR